MTTTETIEQNPAPLDPKESAPQTETHAQVDVGGRTECLTCGRNCQHGGGTSGGAKGGWSPTARSELKCPSCKGKLHRKESRVAQELLCGWRQMARYHKHAELPHLTKESANELNKFMESDSYVPPPTEREIALLVATGSTSGSAGPGVASPVVNAPIVVVSAADAQAPKTGGKKGGSATTEVQETTGATEGEAAASETEGPKTPADPITVTTAPEVSAPSTLGNLKPRKPRAKKTEEPKPLIEVLAKDDKEKEDLQFAAAGMGMPWDDEDKL